jgi:hypothetical protein
VHPDGGLALLLDAAPAAHLVAHRDGAQEAHRVDRHRRDPPAGARRGRAAGGQVHLRQVQPPKTLPPALASAGMAMVRSCGPSGASGGVSAMLVSSAGLAAAAAAAPARADSSA